MAKRFTDTEKWERPWFRSLDIKHKLLWCYVLDRCDIAGVWYVDFGLASFLIGFKYSREIAERVLEKQIEVKGDRWFIKDFVSFQYGNLTEANKIFWNVQKKIDEFKEGAYIPHKTPINGVMVMDKDIYVSSSLGKSENPLPEIPEDLKANESEIKDWLEYKKQKGQTYKPKGLEALWRSFRAIPPDRRRESVDHSMANNWSGLFEKRNGQFDKPDKEKEFQDELKRRKELNARAKAAMDVR